MVTTSVMQSVPLKKSVPVSFKALAAFIQTSHEQDPEGYAEELKKLDDVRQAAVMAVPSMDGIQKLAQYYGQLRVLPSRFLIGEDGIKVNFSWFNFAGKEKKAGMIIMFKRGIKLL